MQDSFADGRADPEQDDGDGDESAAQQRPGRLRSATLSSLSFDFASNLLPLPLSEDETNNRRTVPERPLGLVNGIALVVGLQIGSGIFSTPGTITADTGSVGASLLVWLGSGLLAWTGAASFAELGSAIPLNGGAQAYLNYSFGSVMSFEFSWTAIMALKPGSAAIIAIIFGEYVCRIIFNTAVTVEGDILQDVPVLAIKGVAIASVAGVSLLNALSTHIGTRAQIVLTSSKLLALVAIAVMGFVQLGLGRQSPSLQQDIFRGSSHSPGKYALALYSSLWSYDGWDQTNYIAGEMEDTARDLPRVIHISMSTVISLFLVANICYFIVLPQDIVAHSNTVALDFGRALFGPVGGLAFAAIVAVSCFGALNSSLYTSARLIYAAGKEGYLPKYFARLHPKRETPVNSIILQSALTVVMILIGNFRSLVSFYGVCSWFWYLATVTGLLYLRVREPELQRPYRTWLPTPIIFSIVAIFLMIMPCFSAPLEALAAFGFIALGLPVYYLTKGAERSSFSYSSLVTPFASKAPQEDTSLRDERLEMRSGLNVERMPLSRISEATEE
ncbi:uncharacterized protein L969DRAFT_14026 [Mixia osmundae IAM 14324]|uniref:Amino acid permease/ SLC12A domain-containing protein n=1 Tax=Mixia osmundae (strain CBS 9802 / IAM 14324 / JCM 22182 / KY 12970) TaxID=764103 RepID=G7DSR0_MIXOS|nr:uncharacterized protein L969DRAFT_14026 [Mixia osmundae IAM 14324]KEI41800.1 hypothetical protein L969DRAFT_14026 [Mixia osmundae IAM 14324]GAA93618.1 hypothetical protein E5Q_00262 [Mixia osmundae IAM 14324]